MSDQPLVDPESEKKPSFHLFGSWPPNKDDKNASQRRGLREELLEEDGLQDPDDDETEHDVFAAVQPSQKQIKPGGWSFWADAIGQLTSSERDDGVALQVLVDKARSFQKTTSDNDKDTSKKSSPEDDFKLIEREFKMVFDQMEASFPGDVDWKLLNPLSFQYFLETDESRKTPSWKRRQHRFCDDAFDFNKLCALHDALYLAEAAYLDTVDDVTQALHDYKGGSYLLVYCQVEAEPREPAHFIALKKGKPKQTGPFPWQKDNVLEVLMVVRGTKEISDMLSDCLLDTRDYRGGAAHDGVCQSGLYLVEKHTAFLEHLLAESGRDSLRLSLIGHSLGAGAASIACIEFNQHDKMEATCVGFGCPALLTKELAQEWESRITTIVCDADCVPRMSKDTVANLMLNVMGHDWTAAAVRDVQQLIDVLQEHIPFELPQDKVEESLGWVTNYLQEHVQPGIATVSTDRSPVQLYPPGKCIHLYRDGEGVSMHYVSCNFFNELDVCYSMVNDHLIPTGYNRLLHDMARQRNNDSTFFFRNDVNALRKESHRRVKKVVEETAEAGEEAEAAGGTE